MPTKKWTIGGIDYEVVNATDMSVDSGDEKLGDIMSFTDELATKVEEDRIKGEKNAEAAVRLDGDHFFTGGGSPRLWVCHS